MKKVQLFCVIGKFANRWERISDYMSESECNRFAIKHGYGYSKVAVVKVGSKY